MKRWHQESRITLREWSKHRARHIEENQKNSGRDRVGMDVNVVECVCDDQVGRFRKKKAFDCGNSRCQVCHFHKFPKRLESLQEGVARREFQKEIAEMRFVS